MTEAVLLLGSRERLASGPAGRLLARWCARGDTLATTAAGREAALRSVFEFIGATIPVAALCRALEADDAALSGWLRADPAWVMADAVTLRLLACGDLRLDAAESDALTTALKPLFGDAGFPLEPVSPSRWYLRCPVGAKLPTFSPPSAALGDDLSRHLPQGYGDRQWRHLLNEAQIILTNHPVNAERARRNLAPVNSVWIWGAGVLPDFVRTPCSGARSDDELVRALAARSGIPCEPLGEGPGDPAAFGHRPLLDLAHLRDGAMLVRDWLEPLSRGMARREVEAVELRFESGERCRYRHVHRWRLWRRVPRVA